MTKERFNMFTNNSIYNTPILKGEELTKEEWKEGYHYCWDWDGLFVAPDSDELLCCSCHSKGGMYGRKRTDKRTQEI